MKYKYNYEEIKNNKSVNLNVFNNEKIIPSWKPNRGYILEFLPNNIKTKKCIIFIHGGSFVSLSPLKEYYIKFGYLISYNCKSAVYIPDYTLVPYKKYPTQILEIYKLAIYLKQFYDEIIISGGSSGGTIALSTILKFPKLFNSAFLISPWIDLESTTKSYYTRAYCKTRKTGDKMFRDSPKKNKKIYKSYAQLYLGKKSLFKDMIANPYRAISKYLKNLPPLLILVGDNESIRNDSLDFASKAQQYNKNVSLILFDNTDHTWIFENKKNINNLLRKKIDQCYLNILNFINNIKVKNEIKDKNKNFVPSLISTINLSI